MLQQGRSRRQVQRAMKRRQRGTKRMQWIRRRRLEPAWKQKNLRAQLALRGRMGGLAVCVSVCVYTPAVCVCVCLYTPAVCVLCVCLCTHANTHTQITKTAIRIYSALPQEHVQGQRRSVRMHTLPRGHAHSTPAINLSQGLLGWTSGYRHVLLPL
jgi:hypothetical protein